MSLDPWYTRCCYCGKDKEIQWHHVFIFAGRQVNAKWAIVPACEKHHREVNTNPDMKDYFQWIALNRATNVELKAMSKAVDYLAMRERANEGRGEPY